MKLIVTIIIINVLFNGFSSGTMTTLSEKQTIRIFLNEIVKSRSFDNSYQVNSRQDTVQKRLHQKEFCPINGPGQRSSVRPTSVHQLRPGDIDVIGAMGDSLTAANGALATHVLQIVTEDRALSWSGGGNGNWQTFVTLPNLIKAFNPQSTGYSHSPTGYSYSFEDAARFNVAEPSTQTNDLMRQTKLLISRMRSDKRVNIKNDWKLITIMTGSNDFCKSICIEANNSMTSFFGRAQQNLVTSLRLLRKNLPRSLINLVIPVDPIILLKLTNPPIECQLVHRGLCPCYTAPKYKSTLKRTIFIVNQFNEMVKKIAHTPEFHTNDFEVNLIKFTKNMNLNKANGKTDYTLLSKDCFHVSQKGHHFLAKNLWNSMLTPESERSDKLELYGIQLKCPTAHNPFFRTSRN